MHSPARPLLTNIDQFDILLCAEVEDNSQVLDTVHLAPRELVPPLNGLGHSQAVEKFHQQQTILKVLAEIFHLQRDTIRNYT